MLLIGEAVGLVMGRLLKYVCEPKIDLEIMFLGASEMAQWTKALAAEPEFTSQNPHGDGGENQLP